jgi:hypothetical protein
MLTSNGFEATRDFCNRSNIIRIKKQPKEYQYRQYAEGDLLEHIRANQSYYLGCVFAIIKEWIARGKPKTDDTGHDFREWNQICDWIVQNLFGGVSLMKGHEKTKERVSNPNMTWLRKVALAANANSHLNQQLRASDIVKLCNLEDIELPGGVNSSKDNAAIRKVGTLMKNLFGESSALMCDEFEIAREEKMLPRPARPEEFREGKVYVIKKLISPQPPKTPKGIMTS